MRRHPSIAFVALLVPAFLVGACIPSSPSRTAEASPASSVQTAASGSPASPSEVPTASTTEEQPSASATTEPTPAVTESAAPSDAGPSASPSAGPGSAAACSGTDNNRTFFEDAAAAVTWTVYCAVLPAGWFVDSGQYRGSGGGKVEISYKGPGGARFELHEGAFCAAADGCVPAGTDTGDASFDGSTGTLVTLDGGGWAVVVDRGKSISWLAVGTGLSQAAFQQLAGDLAVVGG
jgi:hypothetical protein